MIVFLDDQQNPPEDGEYGVVALRRSNVAVVSNHRRTVRIWPLESRNQSKPLNVIKLKGDYTCHSVDLDEEFTVLGSDRGCVIVSQQNRTGWKCVRIFPKYNTEPVKSIRLFHTVEVQVVVACCHDQVAIFPIDGPYPGVITSPFCWIGTHNVDDAFLVPSGGIFDLIAVIRDRENNELRTNCASWQKGDFDHWLQKGNTVSGSVTTFYDISDNGKLLVRGADPKRLTIVDRERKFLEQYIAYGGRVKGPNGVYHDLQFQDRFQTISESSNNQFDVKGHSSRGRAIISNALQNDWTPCFRRDKQSAYKMSGENLAFYCQCGGSLMIAL